MSADDVRISEALEAINDNLIATNEQLEKLTKELAVIASRFGGFLGFLEDYAQHNFDS